MRAVGLVVAGLAVGAVGAFVEELVRPRPPAVPGRSAYVAPAPADDSGERLLEPHAAGR